MSAYGFHVCVCGCVCVVFNMYCFYEYIHNAYNARLKVGDVRTVVQWSALSQQEYSWLESEFWTLPRWSLNVLPEHAWALDPIWMNVSV